MERKGRFSLWRAMLLIAALLTALPAAGTAEPDPDGCPDSASNRHDWQLAHEDAATCESAGTKYWYCDECGKQATETIQPLGHQWGEWQGEPSCTQETMRWRQCTVCQATESETVPPLDHAWDNGRMTKPQTCTTDGERTYTCTRCGETRTKTVPAAGHDSVLIPSVAATCTTPGKSAGVACSVCGEILTEQQDIPARGHSWNDAQYTAPTCTTDGSWVYTCTECGETRTETVPAYGHAWDSGVVTTPYTCTTDGVRVITCNNCGETRTESIPATGHNPVPIPATDATCTTAGKTEGKICTLCGTEVEAQQVIPALGHSWDGGAVTTAATCTAAGVKTYTCTRCGETQTESIPATGHTAETIPAVEATCTAGGKTEGSRCATCGAVLTAQQDTPALGHSWDGGQAVGEDGILVPGVMIYTCGTCGATKAETLPLKEADVSALAGMLRTGGAGPGGEAAEPDGTELRIVTQPAGGTVPRDGGETRELTVEAAGGVPPYHYQWYRESADETAASGAFAGTFSGAAAYIMERYGSPAKQIRSAARGTGASRGLSLTEADASIARVFCALAEPTEPKNAPEKPVKLLAGEESDRFGASSAGLYYCKVTDSEGNSVWSDPADVRWRIRIAVQPEDGLNEFEQNVYLHVEAADGVLEPGQDYTYRWFSKEGFEYHPTDPDTLHVTSYGMYYCEASDGVDTVNSNWVTVYNYLPLKCELSLETVEDQFLDTDGETTISLYTRGGLEPVTIAWGLSGEEEVRHNLESSYTNTQVSVTKPGLYHLSLSDSLGNSAEDWQWIYPKQLSILTQPEGGTLPKDWNPHTFNIMMENGQQPFTYTLYESDDYGNYYPVEEKEGENWKTSFDVYFEGDYYIEVLDSEGGWVRSDTVRVDAYHNLEVEPIPDGVIDNPDVPYHVEVKASGGELPYTYEWYVRSKGSGSRDIRMNNTESGIDLYPSATEEWYWCVVTDAAGEKVRSDDVTVTFTGSKPFITKHPVGYHVFIDGGGLPKLTCEAICGNGREPRYRWEYFLDGAWHDTKWRTNEYTPSADIVRGGCGSYRCVVSDPTGKSVESKTATVYMDMQLLSYQQVGTEKLLKLDFRGGVAPFDIKVTSYHGEVTGSDWKAGYQFAFTLTDHYTGIRERIWDETKYCSIQVTNDYDHTVVDIGIPELYSRQCIKTEWNFAFIIPIPTDTYMKFPYLYMVTVTDAIGNTMMTQYVTCQWD